MTKNPLPRVPTAEDAEERVTRELLSVARGAQPSQRRQYDFDLDLNDLDRRYYEENGGSLKL